MLLKKYNTAAPSVSTTLFLPDISEAISVPGRDSSHWDLRSMKAESQNYEGKKPDHGDFSLTKLSRPWIKKVTYDEVPIKVWDLFFQQLRIISADL